MTTLARVLFSAEFGREDLPVGRAVRYHLGEPTVIETSEGPEKRCPCCREWWPLTEEFYYWIATKNKFHSSCKACHSENSHKRGQTRSLGRIASPGRRRIVLSAVKAEQLALL